MNSVLQSLFHLPIFRRLVYEIDSQSTEPNKPDSENIILNLQLLFAKMQLQIDKKSISTDNLTQSFGWKASDSFMQHDVQEFLRVLLDNIEKKLKNTEKAGAIKYIFGGIFRSYIINEKEELQKYIDNEFYDISLEIVNQQDDYAIDDLYSSFRKYNEVETLNGDNQYESEDNSKEDASMFTRFVKLPRVLCLQLKRFQIDPSKEKSIKINSFFRFYKTINLSKYAATEIKLDLYKKSHDFDEATDLGLLLEYEFDEFEYELYGILVHTGTTSSGHYTVYLSPSLSNKWYQFNDSTVQEVDNNTAIDNNFGGPDKTYSAYMLIYIKKQEKESLFTEVEADAIPENIVHQVEEDNIHNQKEIELFTAYLFTEENTIIPNSLSGNLDFSCHRNDAINIQISKNLTVNNLYSNAAQLFETTESQLEIWQFLKSGLIEKFENNKLSLKNLPNSMNLFVFVNKSDDDLAMHNHSLSLNILSLFVDSNDDTIPIFAFIFCPLTHPLLNFLFSYEVESKLSIIDYFATVVTRKLFHSGKINEKDNINKTKSLMNVFLKQEHCSTLISSDEQTFAQAIEHSTIKSGIFLIELTDWDYFEIPQIDKDSYAMDIFYSNQKKNELNFFDSPLTDTIQSCNDFLALQSDINSLFIKSFAFHQKIKISYPNLLEFGLFQQFIKSIFEPNMKSMEDSESHPIDSTIQEKTHEIKSADENNLQIVFFLKSSVTPLIFDNTCKMLAVIPQNEKHLSVVFLNAESDLSILRVYLFISQDSITVSEKVERIISQDLTVSELFQMVILDYFTTDLLIRGLQLSSDGQIILHTINLSEKVINLSNPIRIEKIEKADGVFISVSFVKDLHCDPFLFDLSELDEDITIGQIQEKIFQLINYQHEKKGLGKIEQQKSLKFTFFGNEHQKLTNLKNDTLINSIDQPINELYVASYSILNNEDHTLHIFN